MLFSCKKEVAENSFAESLRTASETIISEEPLPLFGDPSKDPELYIPEDEGGWETSNPNGRVGLYNAYKRIETSMVDDDLAEAYGGKLTIGQSVTVLGYDCLVANGIPGDKVDTSLFKYTATGERDWVVDRTAYSGGTYQFKGYLQVVVYRNGEVVASRKKEDVYFSNTHHRIGATTPMWYSGNTMSLAWLYGDNYFNYAVLAIGTSNIDDKYVVAVSIAPYGNVPGDDPSNNTSFLPFSVVNGEPLTDTTAFEANGAKVPENVVARLQRGRYKGVNISWSGNAYAYCVERDGVMIAVWQDIRSYYDPNGNRNSVYRIVARNQGKIPDAVSEPVKPVK